MKRDKFPKLIHVIEDSSGAGEPFLYVVTDGPLGGTVENTTPCAIYQRVSVGRIEVTSRFVEGRKARKAKL